MRKPILLIVILSAVIAIALIGSPVRKEVTINNQSILPAVSGNILPSISEVKAEDRNPIPLEKESAPQAAPKKLAAEKPAQTAPIYPQLSIPAISLTANIKPVGTEPNGEMSVPTGKNEVGWYKDGAAPGEIGSAVLAAHVYLAFKNLKNLQVGSDLYVTDKNGSKLHFVVSEIHEYKLSEAPADLLFNQNDAARLNLVTCSGTWIPSQKTYDHRLVIFAKLIK